MCECKDEACAERIAEKLESLQKKFEQIWAESAIQP